QAAPAPGEIELKLKKKLGAVCRQLGVQAEHAGAQPPLERAHLLPLQAIGRIAIGLALAQRFGAELAPGIAVMTMLAGEVHLTAPAEVLLSARFDIPVVQMYTDRQPARLVRHVGGEAE